MIIGLLFSLSILSKDKTLVKRYTKDAVKDENGVYYFTWNEDRSSWIAGNSAKASSYGNGVVASYTKCPETIEIPGYFTYDDVTAPVETIGTYAFARCANSQSYLTKTIFVPKEVKIIQERAFENNYYLTNFTLEEGSELEIVEKYGLGKIGNQAAAETSLTPMIVLPQSLYSAYNNSISMSYLFTTIVYCGSFELSNSSDLDLNQGGKNEIKVTDNYEYLSILGTTGFTRETNVSEYCYNFVPKRTVSPSCSATQNREQFNKNQVLNQLAERIIPHFTLISFSDFQNTSNDSHESSDSIVPLYLSGSSIESVEIMF